MPGGAPPAKAVEVGVMPHVWNHVLLSCSWVLLLGCLGLLLVIGIRVCMRKSERWLRNLVSEALDKEKQKEQDSAGRYSDSSQTGSSGANGSLRPWSSDGPNAFSEQLAVHEGWVRVGKIQFDPKVILGRGCEGTTVFSGEYDQRAVAVKRMLPECLTIADREVTLLRESDQHPNVLRYYCTEQDFQFRYIALDLCHGTLKDFAEHAEAEQHFGLSARAALNGASRGLAHLHRLDIVHRDLKPANVLLRRCAGQSGFQVVISDFGLCKKLSPGRGSFSRQSGLRGTEGWIAPEMMREDGGRMTFAVDIFSLGCVFYYVLSRGSHPFGEGYSRQTNIIANHYRLDRICSADGIATNNEDQVAHELIEAMISADPNERPHVNVVLKHPFFWDKNRQLHFFQEVSDRIEKLPTSDPLCEAIEADSHVVIGGDWTRFISRALADDLRRFRTYQGWRVVDLIRAIRNKKHHFRELAPALQAELGGGSPDRYIAYFLDRFPLLLSSVYSAVRSVSNEDIFRGYYDASEWSRGSPARVRRRVVRVRGRVERAEDLDWRGDSFRRQTTTQAATAEGATAQPVEEKTEEDAEKEPVVETVGAEEEERQKSPEEEQWIDISRSTRRNRVRLRKKKKKKKWTPPLNPRGGGEMAEVQEEDEEEEEEEDAEEEEEG